MDFGVSLHVVSAPRVESESLRADVSGATSSLNLSSFRFGSGTDLEPERSATPNTHESNGAPEPKERPSHRTAALLGACNATLATAFGSSLAYGGLALELGQIPSAVVGVTAGLLASHQLARESFVKLAWHEGAELYPTGYSDGLLPTATWLMVFSGAGFVSPEGAGSWVLGTLVAAGSVALLVARSAKKRYQAQILAEQSSAASIDS